MSAEAVTTTNADAPPERPARGDRVLKLIALFKAFKVVLLVGIGLATLRMLNPWVADRVHYAVASLNPAAGGAHVRRLLEAFMRLTPRKVELVAAVAFAYAALFSVEGVGLWLGKHWAEYLTTIATASLIPFEVYELAKEPGVGKALTLAANLAVLVYLVWRLKTRKG